MHPFTTVLIAAAALAQAPADTATPKTPAAVVTRQMEFQLPFQVPQGDAQRPAPVEVRLFVSSDQGRTWQTHSRVRPDKAACPFETRSDGDYWFMIRTVDRRGNLWPQAAPQPEMHVTVDTQPPQADLVAAWKPTGEISATWQVADTTLKPTSPKLQYRAAATDPWQTVAITPASADHPHNQSGKATWWPRSAAGPITVRFEALDEAGNPAVVQRTLAAPGATNQTEQAVAKQATPQPPVANQFAHTNRTQPPANQPQAPAQPPARNMPTCNVKLTSTARQQDSLTIRWQTYGTSTLTKTIHIAYSEAAAGPWKPVALNQQDDGHHVWQFDQQVPDYVFLLIEVVDRSGASSRYITPEPLRLRLPPTSIPHTGQAPAEYRFF